jgi:hypothetical protein
MRREFRLPEADEAYLNGQRLPWETIVEGGSRWLLIHEYPIAAGYNHATASVAPLIPPGYADTQIDMVYVYPPLAIASGRGINALSTQTLDGKVWQRWSRHRTPANPWRPGIDDVSTHLMLVDDWLGREQRAA